MNCNLVGASLTGSIEEVIGSIQEHGDLVWDNVWDELLFPWEMLFLFYIERRMIFFLIFTEYFVYRLSLYRNR